MFRRAEGQGGRPSPGGVPVSLPGAERGWPPIFSSANSQTVLMAQPGQGSGLSCWSTVQHCQRSNW